MATLAEDVETLKRQVVAMDRQLKVYERWFDQTAGSLTLPGGVAGNALAATVPVGTAPLLVTSTTKVANLNVDQVDGLHILGSGYTLTSLAAPLTSTSWDGDARSSEGKTLIDLSAVFGAPAGIKAVLVRVLARDSASAASTSGLGILLSPNSTASQGPLHARCDGRPNDVWEDGGGVVSCDANGDVYYQTYASGAGTLDVFLQIWGYWI